MQVAITPPREKTTLTRQSNIELFRILAMFLVLVVHADFFSIQAPTIEDFHTAPLPSTMRVFWECVSIGCVNMFVLISGWFGIRPKAKSFFNFVFQCLFFLIGIYAVCLITGLAEVSLRGIAGCFVLLQWNWFIKAYIGLYILSPILNAYIEKATARQLGSTIFFFYVFQTIYAWISAGAVFFEAGYSTMSFIGLYLLAQYVRKYPHSLTQRTALFDFSIWSAIVVGQTLMGSILMYMGLDLPFGRIFSYVNPLNIISSLYLLLAFSKIKLQSRFINWVATSCFAVFLLHTNPNLCRTYFVPFVQHLYDSTQGIYTLLVILLFLIIVFAVAVLIDQLRIVIWKWGWNQWETRMERSANQQR